MHTFGAFAAAQGVTEEIRLRAEPRGGRGEGTPEEKQAEVSYETIQK